MENNWNEPQIALPNANTVLVLGIISIVGCCCYGVPSIICGIIALVLAKSASDTYAADPQRYTQGSYGNLKAGKICAIIGLILSVVFIIYLIWAILHIGLDTLTNPEAVQEMLQEILNKR